MFKHSLKHIRFFVQQLVLFLLIVAYAFIFNSSSVTANQNLETSNTVNKEKYFYSPNIIVSVDNFPQAIKLFKWLDLIQLTESGKKTLESIDSSGHQLFISHSKAALLSAGVTGAPLSSNLTNGVGESVYIKFYLDMEFHGSNCVMSKSGKYIKFSAVENLFHELVHAKHKMNGTWLYFDSEGQAIREENQFRKEWSLYRSINLNLRSEYAEWGEVKYIKNGQCMKRFSSINSRATSFQS